MYDIPYKKSTMGYEKDGIFDFEIKGPNVAEHVEVVEYSGTHAKTIAVKYDADSNAVVNFRAIGY